MKARRQKRTLDAAGDTAPPPLSNETGKTGPFARAAAGVQNRPITEPPPVRGNDAPWIKTPPPEKVDPGMLLPTPPPENVDPGMLIQPRQTESIETPERGRAKGRKSVLISPEAARYTIERARHYTGRFGIASVAWQLAAEDLKRRATITDGVIRLPPPSPFDRFVEDYKKSLRGGRSDVWDFVESATRRSEWDAAKASGDPDRMTRAAKRLIDEENAQRARRGEAPLPVEQILNPPRETTAHTHANKQVTAADKPQSLDDTGKSLHDGYSLYDPTTAATHTHPRSNADADPGEIAEAPTSHANDAGEIARNAYAFAGRTEHVPLVGEQAKIALNEILSAPTEARTQMLREFVERFGSDAFQQLEGLLSADTETDNGSAPEGGVGRTELDAAAESNAAHAPSPDRHAATTESARFLPVGWFDWMSGDKSVDRSRPNRHHLETANVAKELQYFSYDPADFERGVHGWSGPLVVFDDVFPARLPRPLNQRFFRQNRRGLGGYLARRHGSRDYAFLIKGVEVSDSDRRGPDLGSAIGPASIGQVNEVAEDVYQQLKAQGVFRDVKMGGSLLLTGHSQGAPQAQLLALYIITRATQDPDNRLSEAEALRGIKVRAFGGIGARDAAEALVDQNGRPLNVPRSVLENIDAITYLLDEDPASWSDEPYVGEAWLVDTPDASRFTPEEEWAVGPLRAHPRSAYRAADYRTARKDERPRYGRTGNPRLRPRRNE